MPAAAAAAAAAAAFVVGRVGSCVGAELVDVEICLLAGVEANLASHVATTVEGSVSTISMIELLVLRVRALTCSLVAAYIYIILEARLVEQ